MSKPSCSLLEGKAGGTLYKFTVSVVRTGLAQTFKNIRILQVLIIQCEKSFSHYTLFIKDSGFKISYRTSLVFQRLSPPATAGKWVRSLVWEDSTCCGIHLQLSCITTTVPQLLKPVSLEPVVRDQRSRHSEEPIYLNEEWPPLTLLEKTRMRQRIPSTSSNK